MRWRTSARGRRKQPFHHNAARSRACVGTSLGLLLSLFYCAVALLFSHTRRLVTAASLTSITRWSRS